MKNIGMGYDPRGIANAILDIADRQDIPLSNLQLNKILFFVHSDCLLHLEQRLSSLTFEAWQYGPVLPIIYHQFKPHKARPIESRATKIDPRTGEQLEVEYGELNQLMAFIEYRFAEYSKLSPTALVAVSHEETGPWYQVWHGNVDNIGMKITDDLILRYNAMSKGSMGDSHARLH